MKVKRTFAPDIRQAMRRVREEQGADAVILGNRKVDGGVEIISAVDYDEDVFYQAIEQTADSKSSEKRSDYARVAASMETPEPAHEHVLMRTTRTPTKVAREAGNLNATPKHAAKRRVSTARAAQPQRAARPQAQLPRRSQMSEAFDTPAAPPPIAHPQPVAATNNVDFAALQRELRDLRGLMENQLNVLGWNRMSRRHPSRVAMLNRLSEMDIGTELARELTEQLGKSDDLEKTWRDVLATLARRVPIAEDDFMARGGVVALVGATGVGKTTTIAKLAARFTLQHGKRDVALVTTDTYRIGAQEQLLHYAQIIGIPLYAANNGDELENALTRLCDKKLVLIDTAGMSQRDVRLIEQFSALRSASPLLRSYLVMSANTQLAALDEAVRAFGASELAGCIVTKLDESTSLGAAITASIRHQLPIAYVCAGQRVPEDISPARAHRIVGRAVPLARRYGEADDAEAMAVRFAGMNGYANG